MIKRKYYTLFSIICLLILSLGCCDIVKPGYKPVSGCYKVVNLDEYPDYVFKVFDYYCGWCSDIPITPEIFAKNGFSCGNYKYSIISFLKPNDCIGNTYKFDLLRICAMKKEDYNGGNIKENAKVICSKTFRPLYREVPVNSPITGLKGTIKIIDITDSELKLDIKTESVGEKTKKNSENTNKNEKPIDQQNTFNILYIIIPIIAIIIIGLIILSKQLRK